MLFEWVAITFTINVVLKKRTQDFACIHSMWNNQCSSRVPISVGGTFNCPIALYPEQATRWKSTWNCRHTVHIEATCILQVASKTTTILIYQTKPKGVTFQVKTIDKYIQMVLSSFLLERVHVLAFFKMDLDRETQRCKGHWILFFFLCRNFYGSSTTSWNWGNCQEVQVMVLFTNCWHFKELTIH